MKLQGQREQKKRALEDRMGNLEKGRGQIKEILIIKKTTMTPHSTAALIVNCNVM